jgi:hypothetical protein
MLKGIDLKETKEYIASTDTADNPTRFIIGNISNRRKLDLFVDITDKDGNIDLSKAQSKSMDILKEGLKAIKNLDGKDYDAITDETLDMLSFPIAMEVAAMVIQLNFVVEQERKN